MPDTENIKRLNEMKSGETVYVHHSLFINRKVDENVVKKGVPGYIEKPDNTHFAEKMTEEGLELDMERYKQDKIEEEISGKVAEREQVAYKGDQLDLEDFLSNFADKTAMNENLYDTLNSKSRNVREKAFEILTEKNLEAMKG